MGRNDGGWVGGMEFRLEEWRLGRKGGGWVERVKFG